MSARASPKNCRTAASALNSRAGRWWRSNTVTYLIVIAALTACERSPDSLPKAETSAHGLRIAVVGAHEAHPQWPGIRGGAQRYFTGVPSLVGDFAAAREATPQSLVAAVERVLERKPNAVCIQVTDADAARPAVDLIVRSQVILVTMGTPTGDERATKHIGVDWPGGAELLAANLPRIAAGRKSYLFLHARGRDENATLCYQRFASAVARRFEVTCLQELNATNDPRSPATVVADMLRLFPHAGLLLTLETDVWLTGRAGWLTDLRALNREFRFATLSAVPVLWPRLGTPEAPAEAAALVGPLDGELGYAAVEAAARKLLSPTSVFPAPVIPCELVTPENLADFARRYSAAANGLNVAAFLPAPSAVSRPANSGP